MPFAEPLAARRPQVSPQNLVAGLEPSFRFAEVSFDTYIPDPDHPSQAEAVDALRGFAESVTQKRSSGGFLQKVFGAGTKPSGPQGIYLDGGFGVGKTHLLASLYHAAGEQGSRTISEPSEPSWSTPTLSGRWASARRSMYSRVSARMHRRVRAR